MACQHERLWFRLNDNSVAGHSLFFARKPSGGEHDIEMVLSRVRGRIVARFAISARSFILLFMYRRGNFRGPPRDIVCKVRLLVRHPAL